MSGSRAMWSSAVLSAAIVAGVSPATASGTHDVLTYRGDHARTGVMPGPGPRGHVATRWVVDAGGPIASQPAVVDGVVLVATARGTLHALDLASGAFRWSADAGAPSRSSPTVVGDLAILGTSEGAFAIAVQDGAMVWASPEVGQVAGTPAVVGTTALFGTWGGTVAAVDILTGTPAWTRAIDGFAANSIAATDELVVVAGRDGVAVALDPRDGRERWRHALGDGARIATPTIADGRVFLATLDGGTREAGGLEVLEARRGSLLWRVAAPGGRPVLPPAVTDGRAFFASADGSVHAVDATTGAPAWRHVADGVMDVAVAVSDGVVYAASNDTSAFALDAERGEELWRVPIEGVPYGPAIAGGMVLVGTSVGTLYAIGGDGS